MADRGNVAAPPQSPTIEELASQSRPPPQEAKRPYATALRLAIGPWTVQFRSVHGAGYIKPEMMQKLDDVLVKKTLTNTRQYAEVREDIGTDSQFWHDIGDLIDSAIPSIEQRCFNAPPAVDPAQDPPAHEDYDGLSGALIAENQGSLCVDLERVNSMVAITRNVLTVGPRAQQLASMSRFDKEIFRLINLCVKVTARGYDGDPGSQEEEKWQSVINAFKKVLITSLQFLNNLVTRNERRKLMLWIQLFDSTTPSEAVVDSYQADEGDATFDVQYDEEGPFEMKLMSGVSRKIFAPPQLPSGHGKKESSSAHPPQPPASSPFLLFIGKNGLEVKKQLIDQGKAGNAAEIAAECKRQWESMPPERRQEWDGFYKDLVRRAPPNSTAALEFTGGMLFSTSSAKYTTGHPPLDEKVEALARSINGLKIEADDLAQDKLVDSKMRRLHAAFGADILQRGKDDLMKRLEPPPERNNQTSIQEPSTTSPASPVALPSESQAPPPSAADPPVSEEEDSEEESDYVVPGDDGRGLLTDVPLILGPAEIEVLPMIIMSGIVPADDFVHETGSQEATQFLNLHIIRCYLLMAQDNGRNLLRELLIFVAAWDLREEELYFKFMVKIMEAILNNGLMPFAYQAFRESKDIISPAQAVIMKLLTNIFKARQVREATRAQDYPEAEPRFPLQVDVDMVRFLFTEFRTNIIPQTCALIFLQGKIRLNQASPDDFPLNLWDMERMYEGIYQYLEFFAVLTEHDMWKKMMTDWDLISELVTLLKELDTAIPKVNLPMLPMRTGETLEDKVRRSADTARAIAGGSALAYDPALPPPNDSGTLPSSESQPVAVERPFDTSASANAPNPYPPTTFLPTAPFPSASPTEHPDEFEWRNLKKLAILVLSSLVWRSKAVQDQVRAHQGIEAILNCCAHDEHNPYIREHAIMCLRFLLENNPENQAIVKELEPKVVVPSEVLDDHGYESFMDMRGQVGLRRKFKPKAKTEGGAGGGAAADLEKFKAWDREPGDLAELLHNMMRELPAKVQGVRMEAERAAVAKLDRGFEGSG
ncbi:hypothetical protein EJ05DRAFT_508837 [Pseudovirgaria hyperparasitica]|uniref:Ataxin-10 homolog n=1 Tax=Pseudovirgaria hyperparasitica TaxID=470096 RepID=A0A6A6WC49_9PEZI|nr:uncharacterized protein EJ05DRAFT_508837 [Pseudovirgaria hyperparasitica]KAF2760283.1 hypothetical protein EJ05DRAFT_508837 [Pseudovirgaria hyperparasitica]